MVGRLEKEGASMKMALLTILFVSQFLYAHAQAADAPKSPAEPVEKITLTLDCSGNGKSWRDCYREGDNLCPNGYTILKKSSGVKSAPLYGRSTLVPSKELVIECK